jgi:hypothetical protein
MISQELKLMVVTVGVLALVYYFFIYKEQIGLGGDDDDDDGDDAIAYATTATLYSLPGKESPLLADSYPVLANPGYSNAAYSTEWKGYPIHAANSLQTTNYRYWNTPENGTCIPADMCYGLYGTVACSAPSPPLIAPDINDERRRVNFYQTL